jgi:hypothetical protein
MAGHVVPLSNDVWMTTVHAVDGVEPSAAKHW